MKIRCDVCAEENASVFCSADEAALCESCDWRVHHANKLAGKHLRFSLLHPSFSDSPRCDICQEKRAFLFCKEDRAIFCRECDESIHTGNSHMHKHDRFLLTGVKVSAFSSFSNCYSSSISSSVIDVNGFNPISDNNKVNSNLGWVSTSSISEYLTETLPGWHVEDFLHPSASHNELNQTPAFYL